MQLEDIRTIYFVGIGGIGMSAIARYFNDLGVDVHGYDRTETTLTKTLVKEGMTIHYDEDISQIPELVDLVVYTPAVPKTHVELQYFHENGIPVKKRAEVLGIISKSKKTIAVAGTHGKTTTTSILTWILQRGGLDCTAFLGGIAQNFQSNYVKGQTDWVVVEADEYDRSFLHLHPDIALIMSMDADHLDIYGDEESILETGFMAFAKQITKEGSLYVQDDFLEHFADRAGTQGFGVEKGAYKASNIRVEDGWFVFDYQSPKVEITNLKLPLPGRHNVENTVGAITVALQLGLEPAAIREALQEFKGIKRRFELMHRSEDLVVINDYAHHPTELKAAIGAAKELFPDKKISGAFQPHLYSRTRDFAEGFAEALDELDEIILLDIYPARELPMEGVSSEIIFDKMNNERKLRCSKNELVEILRKRNPEVLLFLGAGDIETVIEDYLMGG
ncbi:MAG: UDP-N-acetylmuramate--L-alanine ligase, partial [Saprospiraceae bacterium]|nr:UDP-N-acetylmuramate--L-alanine ligase [Saprospiraceae bacterium]